MATLTVNELSPGDVRPQSIRTHPEAIPKVADDSTKVVFDEKQEKTKKAQDAERKKMVSVQEQVKVSALKVEDGATLATKTAVDERREKARKLREQQEQDRIKKLEAQKLKEEERSRAALDKKREVLLAAQKRQEERKMKSAEPLATKGTDEHMEKVKKSREQQELERKKRLEAQLAKEQHKIQGAEPLVTKGAQDEHMERAKKAREQQEIERKKRLEAQQLKEQQKTQVAIDKRKQAAHSSAQTKPEDKTKTSANPIKKVTSIAAAPKKAAGPQHLPSRKAQPHSAAAVQEVLPQEGSRPAGLATEPSTADPREHGSAAKSSSSSTVPAATEHAPEDMGVVLGTNAAGIDAMTAEGCTSQSSKGSELSADVESVGEHDREGQEGVEDHSDVERDSQWTGEEGSRTSLDLEPPEVPNKEREKEDKETARARNEQEAIERRKRVDEIMKKARESNKEKLVQDVPASPKVTVGPIEMTGIPHAPGQGDDGQFLSHQSHDLKDPHGYGNGLRGDGVSPHENVSRGSCDDDKGLGFHANDALRGNSSTPPPCTVEHCSSDPGSSNLMDQSLHGSHHVPNAALDADLTLHTVGPADGGALRRDDPPQVDDHDLSQNEASDDSHIHQEPETRPHPDQCEPGVGSHPPQDQPSEEPHPHQDQPSEEPHPHQDQHSEGPHPSQDQHSEEPHPSQDQPSEGPLPHQDQPSVGPLPHQDQPSEEPHPHPPSDIHQDELQNEDHLEHSGDRDDPIGGGDGEADLQVSGPSPTGASAGQGSSPDHHSADLAVDPNDNPTGHTEDDLHHHSNLGGDHLIVTGGTAEVPEDEANKSSSSSITFDEEGGSSAVLKLLEDD